MAVDIIEMQPHDRPDVEALLLSAPAQGQSSGDADSSQEAAISAGEYNGSPSECNNVLSLVAREDGKLVGVVLCGHDDQEGFLHRLTLAASHQDGDLEQALVNKALLKLNAWGAMKTRIQLPPSDKQHLFWESVKWGKQPELGQKPAMSSAITDRLAADPGSAPEADVSASDTSAVGEEPLDPAAASALDAESASSEVEAQVSVPADSESAIDNEAAASSQTQS